MYKYLSSKEHILNLFWKLNSFKIDGRTLMSNAMFHHTCIEKEIFLMIEIHIYIIYFVINCVLKYQLFSQKSLEVFIKW